MILESIDQGIKLKNLNLRGTENPKNSNYPFRNAFSDQEWEDYFDNKGTFGGGSQDVDTEMAACYHLITGKRTPRLSLDQYNLNWETNEADRTYLTPDTVVGFLFNTKISYPEAFTNLRVTDETFAWFKNLLTKRGRLHSVLGYRGTFLAVFPRFKEDFETKDHEWEDLMGAYKFSLSANQVSLFSKIKLLDPKKFDEIYGIDDAKKKEIEEYCLNPSLKEEMGMNRYVRFLKDTTILLADEIITTDDKIEIVRKQNNGLSNNVPYLPERRKF